MMARIRTIKPEFWSDEKLAECSIAARLLFIGSWNFADDEGRMEYSPKRLKMQVFPGDNIDVAPLTNELVKNGLVLLYQVSGREYLEIPNFKKHQRVDHPKSSSIPAHRREQSKNALDSIAELSKSDPKPIREDSRNTPRRLAPEGKGIEGKGIEGKGIEGGTATPDLPASQLARGLLETVGLPVMPANLEAAAAAIESVASTMNLTLPEGYDWLSEKARQAKKEGQPINKFWFQDAKYNAAASRTCQDASFKKRVLTDNPSTRALAQMERD